MVFGARFLLGRLSRVPALKKMAGLWYLLIFRLFPVIRTLGEWFKKDFAVMKARKILLLLDSSSKNGQ